MKFDWEKYLIFAKNIAQVTTQENLRCSISRAYYGAFNALCIKTEFKIKYDKHSALIQRLKELDTETIKNFELTDDDTIRQISDELEYMRIRRNWADYEYYEQYRTESIESTAKKVLEKSELIFDILRSDKE